MLINVMLSIIELLFNWSSSSSLSQIPARTGPTPARSPRQRTASGSTRSLGSTAAKEKVPSAASGRLTTAAALRRSPPAPTIGR